tara:strand:+ start:4442 stop:4666 length:225 start_codon:yes stop_codon:yes gene_type:complete
MKGKHENDIMWWKHRVILLERRLEDLEAENFELKKTISESIENLKKHNTDMKIAVELSENILRPEFKKPKWKKV